MPLFTCRDIHDAKHFAVKTGPCPICASPRLVTGCRFDLDHLKPPEIKDFNLLRAGCCLTSNSRPDMCRLSQNHRRMRPRVGSILPDSSSLLDWGASIRFAPHFFVRHAQRPTLDAAPRRPTSAATRLYSPKHQRMIAFWACRRFSASSNITDCGPSITSDVTSSPRCAGRQCMNRASSPASAISAAFT